MKKKKLTITEADFLLANRRASREEEIEAHGHPVRSRTMVHKSKKVYNRNLIKRAAIKRDDSSYFFSISNFTYISALFLFCCQFIVFIIFVIKSYQLSQLIN